MPDGRTATWQEAEQRVRRGRVAVISRLRDHLSRSLSPQPQRRSSKPMAS